MVHLVVVASLTLAGAYPNGSTGYRTEDIEHDSFWHFLICHRPICAKGPGIRRVYFELLSEFLSYRTSYASVNLDP